MRTFVTGMENITPNEENNKVNEPMTSYGATSKMKVRIFNSFEEAAAAEAMDNAMQSPIERIRETVELILRVYGTTEEQLQARRGKLRINMISEP